jgi:hypothetical protein
VLFIVRCLHVVKRDIKLKNHVFLVYQNGR